MQINALSSFHLRSDSTKECHGEKYVTAGIAVELLYTGHAKTFMCAAM